MRQRTFHVNGERIQIKSRPRTYMGNHAGFYVWINGERQHRNALDRQTAEDAAYVAWVRKYH